MPSFKSRTFKQINSPECDANFERFSCTKMHLPADHNIQCTLSFSVLQLPDQFPQNKSFLVLRLRICQRLKYFGSNLFMISSVHVLFYHFFSIFVRLRSSISMTLCSCTHVDDGQPTENTNIFITFYRSQWNRVCTRVLYALFSSLVPTVAQRWLLISIWNCV